MCHHIKPCWVLIVIWVAAPQVCFMSFTISLVFHQNSPTLLFISFHIPVWGRSQCGDARSVGMLAMWGRSQVRGVSMREQKSVESPHPTHTRVHITFRKFHIVNYWYQILAFRAKTNTVVVDFDFIFPFCSSACWFEYNLVGNIVDADGRSRRLFVFW